MAGKTYRRKIKLEYDYGEVKSGVMSTKQQMALLRADYKATTSEIQAFGKASDKLGARQEFLKNQIKLVNMELAEHKKKLEAAKATGNEKAMNSYAKEIEFTETKLRGLSADLQDVNKQLESQKTFLGKSADEWKSFSKKTKDLGKSLSTKVTLPIAAAGGAAFKMASDLEQAMGKSEVVFEKNINKVKDWAQSSLDNFGLAKVTALETASSFGALLKGADISLEKSTEWSMTLTERLMDLSNFYDIGTEETITALDSIVTGTVQPLRKFGISMTQAALQEYAFANGINKKVSEMTEAEKVQLRYNFVMAKTSQAVGTTAREANTAGAQARRLKETMKELGTTFGEVLVPIILPFIKGLNSLLQHFARLNTGTKKVIVTFAMFIAAIGPLLMVIGSVAGAINNLIKLKGSLVTKTAAATGGISKLGSGFSATYIKVMAFVVAITMLVVVLSVLFGKSEQLNRTLSNIGGTAGRMTNSLNNSARAINNAKIHGSHARGLAEVPFDGYIAELHKGEAVIPAERNPYTHNSLAGDTIIINAKVDDYNTLEKIIREYKERRQRERAGVIYG